MMYKADIEYYLDLISRKRFIQNLDVIKINIYFIFFSIKRTNYPKN